MSCMTCQADSNWEFLSIPCVNGEGGDWSEVLSAGRIVAIDILKDG